MKTIGLSLLFMFASGCVGTIDATPERMTDVDSNANAPYIACHCPVTAPTCYGTTTHSCTGLCYGKCNGVDSGPDHNAWLGCIGTCEGKCTSTSDNAATCTGYCEQP